MNTIKIIVRFEIIGQLSVCVRNGLKFDQGWH